MSALHYASELGQDDTLLILIQHGADPNTALELTVGKSPLHVAIVNGQFNAVTILCEQGGADATVKDKNGDTLLHYAAIG